MLSPNGPARVQTPVMKNFDSVRRNIETHSHGIFDIPTHQQTNKSVEDVPSSAPELPPRADFAHHSRSYLDSMHVLFPILHWPTFEHEVDQVYIARSFHGMSREWISLFFAVMACGALQTSQISTGSPEAHDRGRRYFAIAAEALSLPSQDISMTHTRVALLLSIFASESNMKSVGAIWLASAVRFAQLLRLQTDTEGTIFEQEMRRRLWWSLYTWER
jgi:hypothetical protein